MNKSNRELEVKFYLAQPEAFKTRLETLHAKCLRPPTYELNLRFDTPDGKLTRAKRVLRLRRDTDVRLTYKGPGKSVDGVLAREEIEFSASDFNQAQAFLEALGYQVRMIYEKKRAIYRLEGAEISLDEMPYGYFTEIEVENPALIKSLSQALHLNWNARIPTSYSHLFTIVKQNLNLTFRDLTFENFSNIRVAAKDLGITPADS